MTKITDFFIKIGKPELLLNNIFNGKQRYTKLYNLMMCLHKIILKEHSNTPTSSHGTKYNTKGKTLKDLIIGAKGVLYTPAFLRNTASFLLEKKQGFRDFDSWHYIYPNSENIGSSYYLYHAIHMVNPALKYISNKSIITNNSTKNNIIIFNKIYNKSGIYQYNLTFKSNQNIPRSNRIFMTGIIATKEPNKIVNDLNLITAYDLGKNKNTILLVHNTILDRIHVYAKGSRLANVSFPIHNKTDIPICIFYNTYYNTLTFYHNDIHLITLDTSYLSGPLYPILSLSNLGPQIVDLTTQVTSNRNSLIANMDNMTSVFNINPYKL